MFSTSYWLVNVSIKTGFCSILTQLRFDSVFLLCDRSVSRFSRCVHVILRVSQVQRVYIISDSPQMPVCSYFLKGICNNSDCPYSHVYVSRKAEVCDDFVKGYCPEGEKVHLHNTSVPL